jgi:ribosomal 30S subunit maturation factor RimM
VLEAAGDYRIKATLGITGWLRLSVHSDGTVRHLDVGSTYPGGEEASKGMAVRHLKSYASWVQTVQSTSNRELSSLNHFESFVYEKRERYNLKITAAICSDTNGQVS